MKKRILVITDMDFKGSGYFYLMSPILQEMSKTYDIKVIGLGYTGEEYLFDYSIVSAKDVSMSVAIATNMIRVWKPELLMVGLDIPLQLSIQTALAETNIKYVAITPLENPPLTQSWVAGLMQMDYVFFISELGVDSAKAGGLTKCGYLPVGVDTESFYPPTPEERETTRAGMGYKSDEYIILTVADNQERKNLSCSMKIISMLLHPSLSSEEFDDILSGRSKKKVSDFEKSGGYKYVLVTREQSPVGHRLRDLAITMDINKEFLVIERGIPQEHLRSLYVSSDLFLLTSKAEGLGIPILEAMACGTPVMGTDTGAIHSLLADGRGYLIPEEFGFIDVWGNSWRGMASAKKAVEMIRNETSKTSGGLQFVLERTVEKSVAVIQEQLEVILHD